VNVDAIREFCLAFAEATENLQWGADLCFKIRGKIFVVLSLESVPQGMCFKCTPEKFAGLCEYEGIIPAPYVGRYKWVMLQRLDVLRDGELKDLIRQSYEMVAAKAKPNRAAKPKGSNHGVPRKQKRRIGKTKPK